MLFDRNVIPVKMIDGLWETSVAFHMGWALFQANFHISGVSGRMAHRGGYWAQLVE